MPAGERVVVVMGAIVTGGGGECRKTEEQKSRKSDCIREALDGRRSLTYRDTGLAWSLAAIALAGCATVR